MGVPVMTGWLLVLGKCGFSVWISASGVRDTRCSIGGSTDFSVYRFHVALFPGEVTGVLEQSGSMWG